MYLILFIPFFFSSIRIANFSAKIPNMVLTWLGIFVYIVASIIVLVLLRTEIIPINQPVVSEVIEIIESYLVPQEPRYYLALNQAIIIQVILVFLFLLDVYFAYFASAHVASVAREVESKRLYLTEIKNKAASLSLTAGSLPSQYEQVQRMIQQVTDDIKYISPVSAGAGADAELQIIASLDNLSDYCDIVSTGGSSVSFDTEVKKLQMIVKQRKLLRG
jgi:low affinity Fe/Cu permease